MSSSHALQVDPLPESAEVRAESKFRTGVTPSLAPPRAKHLQRVAERPTELAAQIVDAALTGVPDSQVAKRLGVSPSLVRKYRAGDLPMGLGRVLQLPQAIARDVLRRAQIAVGEVMPLVQMDVYDQHVHACCGLGEVSAALRAHDLDVVLEKVRLLIRRLHEFELELERVVVGNLQAGESK